MGGQTLEQVVEFPSQEISKNPTGDGPEQPSPADPALSSGVGLDDLQRFLPTSPTTWAHEEPCPALCCIQVSGTEKFLARTLPCKEGYIPMSSIPILSMEIMEVIHSFIFLQEEREIAEQITGLD